MRLAALVIGLISVWGAAGSPLAVLDHHLLIAHMAQHLLLMTVAAPLILVGLQPGFNPHPVFCWLAGTAAVMGWHIPALFEIGMRSARWHAVEHACFLAAGLLFWWPVIRSWPRWNIPLYLFLATLPCDALSAFLTFCGHVVYPHYRSAHGLFGISPLADQECAGALMWVWVTFVYLAPAAVVTVQLLSPPPRLSIGFAKTTS